MSITELADIEPQIRQSPKRYTPQWIEKVDALLDVHRSHFLFRDPSPAELELHKTGLELARLTGFWLNSVMENPEVSLRLRLITDAFTLFHDPGFSEAEADRLLKEVFPE